MTSGGIDCFRVYASCNFNRPISINEDWYYATSDERATVLVESVFAKSICLNERNSIKVVYWSSDNTAFEVVPSFWNLCNLMAPIIHYSRIEKTKEPHAAFSHTRCFWPKQTMLFLLCGRAACWTLLMLFATLESPRLSSSISDLSKPQTLLLLFDIYGTGILTTPLLRRNDHAGIQHDMHTAHGWAMGL
jgi:hypothetical protein